MRNTKKAFSSVFCFLFCIILLSTAESRAQVKKMTAKDLTEESTAILYGKCSKIKSEWNEDKSIIYTYVTIIPEEYIKGYLGPEAVLAIPGGRVDDIIYEVSEMPVFIEGEDVMAFVWTSPAGKNLITGGFQGKMKIEKDSKTDKKMVSGSITTEDTGIPEPDLEKPDKATKPDKVKLEDFVTKLKEWAKN
jgi:hypothetical protein